MSDLKREHFIWASGGERPHGTRFLWVVRGPDLAVQFMCRLDPEGVLEPWNLGYHATFDMGGGTSMEECDFFPDGCFYDGSSLNARPVFDRMCKDGLDGVWNELESYYDELFKSFLEVNQGERKSREG